MKSFQLDQNSNSKQLAEKCNAEGKCIVKRLPKKLMDEEDPVILETLLTKDATLLTMDFTIVEDNPGCIPRQNPGLIIVKARPNTAELMEKLLARFKSKFPQWADFDWSRIYAEIDEATIYISGLTDGSTGDGRFLPFDIPDFAEALGRAMDALRSEDNGHETPTNPDDHS